MKTIIIGASILLALAMTSKGKLSGIWESVSTTGAVTRVVFRSDSTFEAFINKKPFVTAVYAYNSTDSTLSFTDNGCNGAAAIYKLAFYSDGDSMRFIPVSDSCTERKAGMQRLNMGRVK